MRKGRAVGWAAIIFLILALGVRDPAKAEGLQGLRVPPPPIGTLMQARANRIGAVVLADVTQGRSITADVVRQSNTALWVLPLMGPDAMISKYLLTPNTVIWQGHWRFLNGLSLRRRAVNLVVGHGAVVGILEYQNGYGRVVHFKGRWVLIEPLINAGKTNPACVTRHGRMMQAEVTRDTVWNSAAGQLPAGSLVQYTVYGVPNYPVLLGGVEDYGPAPCTRPSPSTTAALAPTL